MVDLRRYRRNRQDEIDGAFLYRLLAELEPNRALASLYERLAATEERHAAFWEAKLVDAGERPGPPRPSRRARVLARLARWLGPDVLVSVVAAGEAKGRTMYDDQPETEGTTMRHDERSHARILKLIEQEHPRGIEGGVVARVEGRHRAIGGNALRAGVLGANDGLVSNLALVMGVAGASLGNQSVVIAGLAGLLAGSSSMAIGEWLSVQSAREMYQRQIEVEREEIEAFPEEEEEELALIYLAKGVDPQTAREMAARVMAEPDTALETKAREELGVDPKGLGGSAWEAAVTSFLLFGVGAVIPVVPFLFLSGGAAAVASIGLSLAALFGLGAGITLFTGKSPIGSGLRQLALGAVAAATTYGVGYLLGVAVS